MTNYCKDCTLYEENELLKENLTIAQNFNESLGKHYTKLRHDMRKWGGCLPHGSSTNLQLITPQNIKEFWKILGNETPAERFLEKEENSTTVVKVD